MPVTVRLQPVAVCDRARTPACHGRLDVPTSELVRGTASVRRLLGARGWGLERAPDGQWLDMCPVCAGSLRVEPAARPLPEAAAAG
jgi:hypothetical protein